jgi:hypothetical protein
MIPGLNVTPEIEEKIWLACAEWLDHSKEQLRVRGMAFLLERYEAVVLSIETGTCGHGPNGTRRTGRDWEQCCGISYEYWNDIAVRDGIDTVLSFVPGDAAADVRSRVGALDDRLYALYEKRPARHGRWWHKCLPKGVIP